MKFIVLPLTDAKVFFTEEELATHRKSVDGTQVIMHEGTLLEKRNALGLATLPSEDTGQIEWTYPNYEYGTDELNKLLNSSEWSSSEEVEETSTTTTSTNKSYWNF